MIIQTNCLRRYASLVGSLALIVASTAHGATSADLVGQVAPLAKATQQGMVPSADERLREELKVLLLDMIESGAFGSPSPANIDLAIDAPRQRISSLGVLVDSSGSEAARNGLRVLGTTPGGSAQRMGLQSGDLITAVNGSGLSGLGESEAGMAQAAVILREKVDGAGSDPLRFDVVRNGKAMVVSGVVASTWIPAVHLRLGDGFAVAAADNMAAGSAEAQDGCGRVSIFDVAPRQQSLHAAALISIDGRRSPFGGQTSFRLSAGTHVLTVAERIESRYLPFNDRLRNSNTSEPYKTLTIHVAANTTYLLAAKLNQDRRNEWRDGAYWEPVIWKETSESCTP
jgi:hypothetical protein